MTHSPLDVHWQQTTADANVPRAPTPTPTQYILRLHTDEWLTRIQQDNWK